MGFTGCKGEPYHVGDLDELPLARELSFNIVKLSEPVAYKLLGYKKVKQGDTFKWEKKNESRVTLDGTLVLIDGTPVYDRLAGGIDATD